MQNNHIMDCRMITIEYKKPFPALERFERYTGEQMVTAVRQVKQDWPSKVGSSIRNAIAKAQEDVKSLQVRLYTLYTLCTSYKGTTPQEAYTVYPRRPQTRHIPQQATEPNQQ